MKQHFLAACLLLCAAVVAPRAYAAIGDQSMDPAANNGTEQTDDSTSSKPTAPPSPTPGSKAAAPVADASANAAALDPNAALFDAITRGDLAAARDAIARGADLNAQNSLGQKPVDASIDLGQNDITFLLLAERPLVSNYATAETSPPAAPNRHGPGGNRRNSGVPAPVEEVAAVKPVANPGTPQPGVGFLGF